MDNNMPLVSIVLPMYNAEKFVGECIQSILSQTYTNFGLLVLDDGSTDGSIKVVESFSDSRIHLIRRKHDYIATLNCGLSESRGKYIARMDADDIMYPLRIEKQVDIMEYDRNITICSSYTQVLGEETIVDSSIKGHIINFHAMLLLGNIMSHSSVMIRRDFLFENNLSYSRNYPYAEDYKLWADIASKGGRLFVIPLPLVAYRVSETQISQMHREEQVNTTLKIKNEVLTELIETSNPECKIADLFDLLYYFNEKDLISESTIFALFYDFFSNRVSKY